MRVLVTGGYGLLGTELTRVGTALGHDIVGAGRADLDITDADQARAVIRENGFDRVIHSAAYTAVDRAESEPASAHAVNVEGTANVARAAAEAGVGVVYISTDYVFDGRRRTPYRPTDATNPLSVYARTKAKGEAAVITVWEDGGTGGPPPMIMRTGWLYGQQGRGFVRAILDRASRGDALQVVADQTGRPTFVGQVARAVLELMALDDRGAIRGGPVWHVAGGGTATWLELAEEALRISGMQVPVRGVSSEEYGAPAVRPAYSVMDLTETERALGRAMADWREVLAEVLSQ